MDQAASEGGSAVTGDDEAQQQKSPEQLREEIEQTREELGDTVEALAHKTDVKAQAKERVASVKDSAVHTKDTFVSHAKDATPDSASSGAQSVISTIKRDPVPFTGIGVFAAGLLVGWLIGRR
ncbi:MAG TPA: DUF3618 domain-containing protein [Solirubrobacteraceae bacterium]|jgi:ElaB/YqjD/DUF883 family membrane-anchored ribosome-binding protein